ncbi:hypothetical protein FJY68_10710 [candidate division WOR-3 bacterium]|uniref:Uncharacterized protein n=1 Tax=candidate division WOR-3 bacterium TaxID=2052148 RepID=A0A937XFN8_UNCW3|nr:hypothetical protein [candidate division WOR-3 bacterium]
MEIRGLERSLFIGLLRLEGWTPLQKQARPQVWEQERGMAMGEDSHQQWVLLRLDKRRKERGKRMRLLQGLERVTFPAPLQ